MGKGKSRAGGLIAACGLLQMSLTPVDELSLSASCLATTVCSACSQFPRLPYRCYRKDPFSVWDSEHVFLTVNSWTQTHNVLVSVRRRHDKLLMSDCATLRTPSLLQSSPQVMVHDRWMFPMVTRAFSFSTLHRGDYSLAVSYSGTRASPGVEKLPIEVGTRRPGRPISVHGA